MHLRKTNQFNIITEKCIQLSKFPINKLLEKRGEFHQKRTIKFLLSCLVIAIRIVRSVVITRVSGINTIT